jgi:hypothetical protein
MESEVATTSIVNRSLLVKRRHRSSLESLKREIVAASLAPGLCLAVAS